VLQDLQKIKRSSPCLLGGAAFLGELEGISSIVSNLSQGIPPADTDVIKFSDFYKLVLKKAENFHFVHVHKEGHIGHMNVVCACKLYGAKALEHQMMEFAATLALGHVKTLIDVQPFRTYKWLLSPAQKEQTTLWIADILKRADVPRIGGALVAEMVADTCTALVAATLGGSSSSSHEVLTPLCKTKANKVAKKKEDAKVTTSASMMKFFSNGAKKTD
jgi:hypothetical protein